MCKICNLKPIKYSRKSNKNKCRYTLFMGLLLKISVLSKLIYRVNPKPIRVPAGWGGAVIDKRILKFTRSYKGAKELRLLCLHLLASGVGVGGSCTDDCCMHIPHNPSDVKPTKISSIFFWIFLIEIQSWLSTFLQKLFIHLLFLLVGIPLIKCVVSKVIQLSSNTLSEQMF